MSDSNPIRVAAPIPTDTPEIVRGIRAEDRIPKKARGLTPEQIEQAVAIAMQGETFGHVAKRIGSFVSTVINNIKRHVGREGYMEIRRAQDRASKTRLYANRKTRGVTQLQKKDEWGTRIIARHRQMHGSIIECHCCGHEVDAIPADRRCVRCHMIGRWDRVSMIQRRKPAPPAPKYPWEVANV